MMVEPGDFKVRTSQISPEDKEEWKEKAPDNDTLNKIINEIVQTDGHKGEWVSRNLECADYWVMPCTIYDPSDLVLGDSVNIHPKLETDCPRGDVSDAVSLFAVRGYDFGEGDYINLITKNVDLVDKYLGWVNSSDYPLRFYVVYDERPYESHKSDKTGVKWKNYDTVALISEESVQAASKSKNNGDITEFIENAVGDGQEIPEDIAIEAEKANSFTGDVTNTDFSTSLEFNLDEKEIEKEAGLLIKDNLSRELTEQLTQELGIDVPTTSSEAIGVEGKAMILAAIQQIKGKNNE